MLVLSRKVDESIVIDRDIVVTVVQCAGKVVRLGFTASRDVRIDRGEVFERRTRNECQLPIGQDQDESTLPPEAN